MLLKWWRKRQFVKAVMEDINSTEWKRKHLTHYCPYAEETIFEYKCSVNGIACTAFECYVELPAPKDETEQAEYLD